MLRAAVTGLALAPLLLGGALPRAAAATPPVPVRTTPVPMLMYHVVAAPPVGAPYPELYVRPADFAAQVRWLERRGFAAVTLRHVWDHWFRGLALPRKAIVLSFDDGYRSVYENASPVLRARGWPGVLNLAVKNVDLPGGLSQSRVRRLLAAGWELAAHSLTHPDLTGLDRAALAREVGGSRTVLRRMFGAPVDFFCYPAGRYDARVVAAVKTGGYLGATTTVDGLARPDRPFELRRIRVDGSDGVEGLAAALAVHGRG